MTTESIALTVFAAGAAFTVWALLGYPLGLMLLGRLRRNTAHSTPMASRELPMVSVQLPVANAERWVGPKLESILAMTYPPDRLEILVGSDGSTDGTDGAVEEFASRYSNIRFFRLPKGGKARALNALMAHASGDILFFTDARQKLDAACLSWLTAPFADPEIGGVCGELIILDGDTEEEQSTGLYWKIEKWIRRHLSRMGTLLVVTGCLYAVRRELAEPLPGDALGDDIFMPQAILRKHRRVVLEERARAYDYPTGMDVEFRRKIRTLAGIYQYVLQRGLGPYPLHFFSYKVARVLLPWVLILIALSTPFLPGWLAAIAGLGQIALYGVALLDPAVPDKSPLKRISSPARAFCMLLVAALFSVSILFRSAESLWTPTSVRVPQSPRNHNSR